MALPVKFGAGRWGKKKGSKTINTAGYIIKFERAGFGQGLLWVILLLVLFFKAQEEKHNCL